MRRSSIRAPEVTARHILLSPYRCRDCRERFWVVSSNAYFLAGIVGVALLVGAFAWNIASTLEHHASVPEHAAPDAGRFASRMQLAEKGDPAAEYEIAMMYANGYDTTKNDTEARKWLERSAEHGNVTARYEYGLALRDGRGTIQDYHNAMKWITLAAEAGHGRAQFALGVMHRLGTGTPVDAVMAYTWLNLAAAQGIDGAATARDTVLTRLSPAEVAQAQEEARRISGSGARAPNAGAEAQPRCNPPNAGREADCAAVVDVRR